VQKLTNQSVNVGNLKTTTDLTSPATSVFTLRVAAALGSSTPGLYDSSTSQFRLRNSNTSGVEDKWLAFGEVNTAHPWVPVVGDWNGDGVDTIGLYNPTNAAFYLKNSNSSGYADVVFGFGTPGNTFTPLAGDWDGDGIDSVGLYDPVHGTFYLRNARSTGYADVTFNYGTANAGWKPIIGDWDGNNTDTVGLYGPNERFQLRNANTAGAAELDFVFASNSGTGANTVPVVGDWTHKGKDTIGIYNTSTNQLRYFGWSSAKLLPVIGAWLGS
jgi:ribosomal protein S16